MSAARPPAQDGSAEPGLTVRVRFKLEDEHAARQLSSQLIDRVHELANLPQCECDVDVDMEWIAARAPTEGSTPADPAPDLHSDR